MVYNPYHILHPRPFHLWLHYAPLPHQAWRKRQPQPPGHTQCWPDRARSTAISGVSPVAKTTDTPHPRILRQFSQTRSGNGPISGRCVSQGNHFRRTTTGESVHSEIESNRERITQFLARLLHQHQDETVVVITHGRTINALCETIFQINQRHCHIRLTDTGVCYFQYLGSSNNVPWQLHYLGRADHLIN